MLFLDKNGNYTSDYLLDGEVNKDMQEKLNKHNAKVFDNCNTEDDTDNFVDRLFERDPFEEGGLEESLEDAEYELFDPEKLDKELDKYNPFSSAVTVDLEELREATKHIFEKFLNF